MTMRPGPYEHLQDDRVYDALEELERRGDPATLALAWLLADDRVSVVVGPRRPEHLQPALADLGYGRGSLPVTEQLAQDNFSVPLWAGIGSAEQERVVSVVQAAAPVAS